MSQGKVTAENKLLFADGKRRCSACDTVKPLSDFHKCRRGFGNANSKCKQCEKARMYAWLKANPERHKRAQREWRHANNKGHEYHQKYTYGLSTCDRTFIYVRQNGCCKVCGNAVPYDEIKTDHNHKTGEVRGLLCGNCNVLVGWVETRQHLLPAVLEHINGKEEIR